MSDADLLSSFDTKSVPKYSVELELPYYSTESIGIQFLNNELYVFGGSIGFAGTKMAFKWNTENGWNRVADMNEGRCALNTSTVIFEGCIWVMGGRNGSYPGSNMGCILVAPSKWGHVIYHSIDFRE